MKRIASLFLFACVFLPLNAQKTGSDVYKARYERQVKAVGKAGVGVETILDKWENDWPEDSDMLQARFNYYYQKSQSLKLVKKDSRKFMGGKPVLSLNDSTGKKVNFFQEVMFDDSLFVKALQYADRAIKSDESDLDHRIDKIAAYISYEKESPDIAEKELLSLIDESRKSGRSWTYKGEKLEDGFLEKTIQEFCYTFYLIGSPRSYEAFRNLSEKLLSYDPGNTLYLDNLGTYWFVAGDNPKKAFQYYNKVLKKVPDDYTAIKNSVLLARDTKNVKLEKKYLEMLARYAPEESERNSASERLSSL